MFYGVIKNEARKILFELCKEKNFTDYAIGCCGAFTIESLLSNNMDVKSTISCDVSLYTNALGFFLNDVDFDIKIESESGELDFLNDYFAKGLEYKVGVLLFLQELAKYHKKKSYFDKRIWNNILGEADTIINQKIERIKEFKENIKSKIGSFQYFAEDISEFVKRVDKDRCFISFPPFFSGAFERDFKFLDEIIKSDKLRIEYTMFDENSLEQMVDYLLENKINFIIGTNRGELFEDKKGVNTVAYTYFSEKEIVSFITNMDFNTRFARIDSDFACSNYNIELASKEDIKNLNIKSKIQIKEVPLDLFDSIRRANISWKIKKLSTPTAKFGVFVDGKLMGIFGIDPINIKYEKSDSFYLLSDLPVSNVGSISKFIAALATTREVRNFLKYKYLIDYDLILTTAFTDRPASMKYRNFWKLHNRGVYKADESLPYDRHYINYSAEMGKLSINDILSKYLKIEKNKQTKEKKKDD